MRAPNRYQPEDASMRVICNRGFGTNLAGHWVEPSKSWNFRGTIVSIMEPTEAREQGIGLPIGFGSLLEIWPSWAWVKIKLVYLLKDD